MSIVLEKLDKLGEGSYGIVYEADYVKKNKKKIRVGGQAKLWR